MNIFSKFHKYLTRIVDFYYQPSFWPVRIIIHHPLSKSIILSFVSKTKFKKTLTYLILFSQLSLASCWSLNLANNFRYYYLSLMRMPGLGQPHWCPGCPGPIVNWWLSHQNKTYSVGDGDVKMQGDGTNFKQNFSFCELLKLLFQ